MARKILLADDSVTAQNMGRKILADAGYDVVTVNNGSAALKRITELKPDLIVLDVYMPGYSGLEVCQRLKDSAETAHIPVLLTVGKLEPFKPEEARRVKADAHIVKPFEASELLTAITKLEDRVVPQPSEGNTDLDTGWKSRLRFPSKKKKEEPEPEREDYPSGSTFRDFRKGKAKTESSPAFKVKARLEPEPAVVPDLPRDVTPEELDALSALVAKLDAPISAEETAPVAEKAGPIEASAAEVAEKQAEVPAAAAEVKSAEVKSAEAMKAVEIPAPPAADIVEEIVEPAAAAVEAPALAVEANRQIEIPAEPAELDPAELTTKVAPSAGDPAAVVAVAAVVNTALFAVEPAPVDRDDEPIFASAPTAVEPARQDLANETKTTEGKPAEELTVEKAAPTVPAVVVSASSKVQEAAEAEEPPSDADLAEALRLLTPATVHAEVSTAASPATLVAAGSRWVAEPVTLSPEEAAISLEAEMFSTFTATPGAEIGSVRINGVSAIAAAVENRLAEAGMAASAKALPQPGTEQALPEYGLAEPALVEPVLVEHGAETTAAEGSVVEAPAEAMASVSNPATPSVEGTELESEKKITAAIEPETIEPEKVEAGKMEAERTHSPENILEEERATFADAVDRDEIKAAAEPSGEPVDEAVAGSEGNQDSTSEVGGRESMGTDGKAKSGKSNWHRIHTAPQSAAAASDAVEAAKQAEQAAEEAPRVMAAAAAEGSASVSTSDASTIASIVDRVMADLRPKIVEEIAKKLAGK